MYISITHRLCDNLSSSLLLFYFTIHHKYRSEKFTAEPRLLLGLARLYEQLNDADRAVSFYKQVLILDASNVEAIACLGAHCFYTDQVIHVL